MLRRLLEFRWVGAVGAVISLFWEGFWLIGPPLGVNGNEQKWYLFWGVVALVVCNVQAFYAFQSKIRHLTTALDDRERLKRAREAIGRLLEQIARIEGAAYGFFSDMSQTQVFWQIKEIEKQVKDIATTQLDKSFESRFLAVSVLDIQSDEATKSHFISQAQGAAWTAYQLLKARRLFLDRFLAELK